MFLVVLGDLLRLFFEFIVSWLCAIVQVKFEMSLILMRLWQVLEIRDWLYLGTLSLALISSL